MSNDKVEIKWNQEILQALMTLTKDNLSVKVGVLADDQLHPGDSIGAAGLAAVHEFGSQSRKIPERSFLRKTLFMKKDEYNAWVERNKDGIMADITKGNFYFSVLPKIGSLWVSYVLECFKTGGFGSWAPNSAETVRRKGSDKPLIDTGALRRSITFEVTDE